MERFLESVESQTFALDAWDQTASFTNIPYIYCFKNDGSAGADFMPPDTMRAAFFAALHQFPILAGHLVPGHDGRMHIHVEKDNLNMPEYCESTSDVHFCDVERAGFAWDALPKGTATVGAFTARGPRGVVKLANVHVVRLREHSGVVLFASISHYAVDGVGYCAFVNRWAETCRWVAGGSCPGSLADKEYVFDRSVFARSLPDSRLGLDKDMRRIYDSPSLCGRALAWVSPSTRGAFLSAVASLADAQSHMFHVSRASISSIRASISEHAGQTRCISDNDVLTALTSCVLAKAMQEANDASGVLAIAARRLAGLVLGQADDFVAFLITDARSRLKSLPREPAVYTGNCVVAVPIYGQMAHLVRANTCPAAFAGAAARVRAAVDATTDQLLGAISKAIGSDPSSFASALFNAMKSPNSTVISNQSRFPLYRNDFGWGAPAWVSPLPVFYANFVSFLPPPPSMDGYCVYMTLDAHVLRRVAQNDLWRAHARLLH